MSGARELTLNRAPPRGLTIRRAGFPSARRKNAREVHTLFLRPRCRIRPVRRDMVGDGGPLSCRVQDCNHVSRPAHIQCHPPSVCCHVPSQPLDAPSRPFASLGDGTTASQELPTSQSCGNPGPIGGAPRTVPRRSLKSHLWLFSQGPGRRIMLGGDVWGDV